MTPRDIVEPPTPTAADYLRWNAHTGQPVTVTTPGEVALDLDGIPVAVGASTVEEAFFAAPVVTLDELTRVGLTPADVPNLTTITPGGEPT